MSTIALYASQINQMNSKLTAARKGVDSFKSDLLSLRNKMDEVDQSICNLGSEMADIKTSSDTQALKSAALESLGKAADDFIDFADQIDNKAAEYVNKAKADFYKKYSWLKPESEKSGWEKFCEGLQKAGEWCKEHWKEIAITAAIVIGCVLAVAAVIASGGTALVPLLAGLLTGLGVASGTAMTIATVASMAVAVIAISSSIISAGLNIADTWGKFDNEVFNTIQNVFNWTSAISNSMYSIGSLYCSFKGITNESLREYSKAFLSSDKFRNAVWGMGKGGYSVLNPTVNQATFWSGLGKGGADIAESYARANGRETLEILMKKSGYMPNQPAWWDWNISSATLAGNASGNVEMLAGSALRPGSVWNTVEKIILNINPKVGSIIIVENASAITQVIQKTFTIPSLWTGVSGIYQTILNIFAGRKANEG